MKHAEIDVKLKEYSKNLNFETELISYLTDEEKIVLEGFKLNFNGLNKAEFQLKNKLHSYVGDLGLGIVRKIDRIINNKKRIEFLEQKYGGRESLDDLALMLSKKQKNILNGYLLNKDPRSSIKLCKEINMSINDILNKARDVLERLDTLYLQKQESQYFIKKYGGEDFLENDFCSYLDRIFHHPERAEAMLLNGLMDYHYTALEDVMEGIGEKRFAVNIRNLKKTIINRLDEIMMRKEAIDALLNKINVRAFEIYLKSLSKLKEVILMEFVIAYVPKTRERIIKENNKLYDAKFNIIESEIRDDLERMATLKR